jgi:hypothetical protein
VNERPLRVRIDRLVLRNVDGSRIRDLPGFVAEQLRRPSTSPDAADRPIPRRGRALIEVAAERIAREVRSKALPP